MSRESVRRGGVGFWGVLFLILLVLKLAAVGQVAHWSWWWVTAPLWGPAVAIVAILVVAAVVGGVGGAVRNLFGKGWRT